MAKKSKTQRAKATTAKANRRERQEREGVSADVEIVAAVEETAKDAKASIFSKNKDASDNKAEASAKKEDKPKKTRFKFLKDVKGELKRVTWPSREDVLRWSGVVVCALLFFGIFTAVLDNLIVTPALVALTGLGA